MSEQRGVTLSEMQDTVFAEVMHCEAWEGVNERFARRRVVFERVLFVLDTVKDDTEFLKRLHRRARDLALASQDEKAKTA
jgi:hypothetical protein